MVDKSRGSCYTVSTMKIGQLVCFVAPGDRLHDSKGMIVGISPCHLPNSRNYMVETFSGHTIIALEFELERLKNEVEIPS